MSFAKDYAFGKLKENTILSKLRKYFNDDTIYQTDNFCKYDFGSKISNRKIEQKSRKNFYSTYPTTLIPEDKLGKDITLVFSFKDGDYFIDYDEEKFKTFEKKIFCRDYRSDFIDMPKPYVYIPINELSKIEIN